jgi:hypothetical protein
MTSPGCQSAQRTGHVPARADPLLHRRSRTPARHRVASPMPLLPCPRVNQTDPDELRFRLDRTEPDPPPCDTASHRHPLLAPCTQCTMPPQRNRPKRPIASDEAHHRPSSLLQNKSPSPLSNPPPSSICSPTPSPSPAELLSHGAVSSLELLKPEVAVRSPAIGEGCRRSVSPF